MKAILGLAAAALLASVTFAAAQDRSTGSQPLQDSQKAERNPSGKVGGTEKNPSPSMQKNVQGPRTNQPAESGQEAERNPSGKTGGSTTNPSPTTGMGEPMGPRTGGAPRTGQAEERNPNGSTGGSKRNPSPR
jgi:hypothetical protein